MMHVPASDILTRYALLDVVNSDWSDGEVNVDSTETKLMHVFEQVPIDSARRSDDDAHDHDHRHGNEEMQQLREQLAMLAEQRTQLENANQAWQLYHEAQMTGIRVKLEEQVTNDEDDDDVMQQRTVEQLIDEMIEQRQQLQKSCAELRASKYRFNDDFVDCVHVKD
jgi:uncharacterized protein (DUF3084 family)